MDLLFIAPTGYQPVYTPTIPYLGPIHGGLMEGMSIYIQGSAPEDMERFEINLRCGESESSDIALHINPRFDGWDKVVFNSYENESWGSEDNSSNMPFTKGENFEMIIMVTAGGYEIKVNGMDFHTFKHRMPLTRVCALHIAGDVSIDAIHVLGGHSPTSQVMTMDVKPVYNPTIPYIGPIHGDLKEGMSIYMQGSLPEDMTRFEINLRCEESESSDIALHINPRFDGWDKVVFNTYENESWGSEEKIRSMPFSKGEDFETVIKVTDKGYEIQVNGADFHTFEHQIPPMRVRALHIAGEVSIKTIKVTGGDSPGSNLPGMYGRPVYNPPVPCAEKIPKGMFPKRTVIIRGTVLSGVDRIHINFMMSKSKDIALHINPRVKEGIVVRNSKIDDDWGIEERHISFNPFKEGQYFDMSVRCGREKFKVFVNEKHLFDYAHRVWSFQDIDMLEIKGKVQISYIHL